jgi:hypothetical protein
MGMFSLHIQRKESIYCEEIYKRRKIMCLLPPHAYFRVKDLVTSTEHDVLSQHIRTFSPNAYHQQSEKL